MHLTKFYFKATGFHKVINNCGRPWPYCVDYTTQYNTYNTYNTIEGKQDGKTIWMNYNRSIVWLLGIFHSKVCKQVHSTKLGTYQEFGGLSIPILWKTIYVWMFVHFWMCMDVCGCMWMCVDVYVDVCWCACVCWCVIVWLCVVAVLCGCMWVCACVDMWLYVAIWLYGGCLYMCMCVVCCVCCFY